jgi:hypothetical protein
MSRHPIARQSCERDNHFEDHSTAVDAKAEPQEGLKSVAKCVQNTEPCPWAIERRVGLFGL